MCIFAVYSECYMMCLIERQETAPAWTATPFFISCKHGQGQLCPFRIGIYSVRLSQPLSFSFSAFIHSSGWTVKATQATLTSSKVLLKSGKHHDITICILLLESEDPPIGFGFTFYSENI